MRILQANKFFYVRGGSERYYFDLCDLLKARGHDVAHFSMKDDRNLPSEQAPYFVSAVDLNECKGIASRARAAARILYSGEAKDNIGRIIEAWRPDVVHFHNITRQLSPSIIDAASARGVPTVETVHDLFLVCPAHSFYVRGSICEACGKGAYWHAVTRRCIDGSLASSALGAAEAYAHDLLRLYRKIDRLIAPSLFLKTKISNLSWVKGRVEHLPYFIPLGPDYSDRNEGYALFAGRISTEKGVGTLLDASSICKEIEFVVAGEGPELETFKRYARSRGLANVRFAGYVTGDSLERLIAGAFCVVTPSLSYENLPLSILEAFARGKPVVAADSGGISELVRDGVTGYVSERGVPAALAEAIERMVSDEALRVRMGKQARAIAGTEYSAAEHYRKLISIYEGVTR
jgi:glycosyltransferase involved in cell wall biosynthesis